MKDEEDQEATKATFQTVSPDIGTDDIIHHLQHLMVSEQPFEAALTMCRHILLSSTI